jgi:cellulose synthase/poly-beta-1,6-N-acetylglucosamine synthase-like glycosyltransferase
MAETATFILTSVAIAAVGLSGFLLAECIAALFAVHRKFDGVELEDSKAIAVIVPAHNEAYSISETLQGIRSQLNLGDRLVVVADNCSDATASIAASAGAEALIRNNSDCRGKGYAVQYAVNHLSADPPKTVLIIDADCNLAPGSIKSLAAVAAQTERPAQARNEISIGATASLFERVSAFAFATKNCVRPVGLSMLNGPCLLTGTGMALPWQLAATTVWANGNIVEDMDLSIRLASKGHFAVYVPNALVTSPCPPTKCDSITQRTRWEHGHLQTIGRSIPPIAARFIKAPSWKLFLLACEICVPPLSLFAMGLGLLAFISALWAFAIEESLPLILSAVSCGVLFSAALVAWWIAGRSLLSLTQLLYVPWYALAKVPLYFAFLVKPQREWVRTGRIADAASVAKESIPAPHILETVESGAKRTIR